MGIENAVLEGGESLRPELLEVAGEEDQVDVVLAQRVPYGDIEARDGLVGTAT